MLRIVVVAIKWHPVAVTIVAGVSMLFGSVGVTLYIKTAKFTVWIDAQPEGGFLFCILCFNSVYGKWSNSKEENGELIEYYQILLLIGLTMGLSKKYLLKQLLNV